MKCKRCLAAFLMISVLLICCHCGFADEQKPKVLVVMSYEEENPWCMGIRAGIDQVLSKYSQLTYFFMNTKRDYQNGPQRAAEAFSIYNGIKPDGVITVNDDAQSMFVVPYLKDKVKTPIMFTGVNEDAEVYGFPTPNISGTLERGHVRESLAFIRQLIPSVHNVCFLVKESPAGSALVKHVKSERSDYPAEVAGMYEVKTVSDMQALGESLGQSCQALYIDSLEGILDDNRRPLDNREVFGFLFKIYQGPVIGANPYHVEQGAVCAVVKTGQEQGELAAEQLLKALNGTPVSQIPIAHNYRGKRIINVDALSKLGITPRPNTLQGAMLVKTK